MKHCQVRNHSPLLMRASSTISVLSLAPLPNPQIDCLSFFSSFQWSCKPHGKISVENVHGLGSVANPLRICPTYCYCCWQDALYTEQIFSIRLHLKWREREGTEEDEEQKERGKRLIDFLLCSMTLYGVWGKRASQAPPATISFTPLAHFNVIYGMFNCRSVNHVAVSQLYPPPKMAVS